MCAGLPAGIEGTIHATRSLWDEHHLDENWGFLLIDAKNAFNEGNRTMMLWIIRHEWPAGATFAFNCYRHYSILVLRNGDGSATTLLSREGVTQGDPISMFAYGFLVLPLVRQLKKEFLELYQPWYADDAGMAGTFDSIAACFRRLQDIGPRFRYFPESSKSILIVDRRNLASASDVFQEEGFRISEGERYLGGFIGSPESQKNWIQSKVQTWIESIQTLATVAKLYPQTTYTGLTKSLQFEWQFVHRVIPELVEESKPLECALTMDFLASLTKTPPKDLDRAMRLFSVLPVKLAGMAFLDPTVTARDSWNASTVVCGHLIAALLGKQDFLPQDYSKTLQDARAHTRERNSLQAQATANTWLGKLQEDQARIVRRGMSTGAWLTAYPSFFHGSTSLSPQEWRDALHLGYGITPPDLPEHCDGCTAKFSVHHALSCKLGGLVTQRHNAICDELSFLASKALTPSSVCDKPLINPISRNTRKGQVSPPAGRNSATTHDALNDDRGDILIQNLWENTTSCIIDVRISDVDAPSYHQRAPEQVLKSHETAKKKKYKEACEAQRRHFTPFVCSTDGLLGHKAGNVAKQLASKLATKWQHPYSQICGWVRARLTIATIRASHMCLRGSRIPSSQISNRLPLWEDAAGLGLLRIH